SKGIWECSVVGQTQQATQVTQASTLGSPTKENWRKIQRGLTMEQVRSILVELQRIDATMRTNWYYPEKGYIYLHSEPYVWFNKFNRVDMWKEPNWRD